MKKKKWNSLTLLSWVDGHHDTLNQTREIAISTSSNQIVCISESYDKKYINCFNGENRKEKKQRQW